MGIKFNKFHVTDGQIKARVHYSMDGHVRCYKEGIRCVTLYAKDYDGNLGKLIPDAYKNDTDSMTDYFDQGRVVLFDGHPLYSAARARAEANKRQ